MRARQYKVQQYNDARFSSITCCTNKVPILVPMVTALLLSTVPLQSKGRRCYEPTKNLT